MLRDRTRTFQVRYLITINCTNWPSHTTLYIFLCSDVRLRIRLYLNNTIISIDSLLFSGFFSLLPSLCVFLSLFFTQISCAYSSYFYCTEFMLDTRIYFLLPGLFCRENWRDVLSFKSASEWIFVYCSWSVANCKFCVCYRPCLYFIGQENFFVWETSIICAGLRQQ